MNKLGEHEWFQALHDLEILFYKHAKDAYEKATAEPDADYWEIDVDGDTIKVANWLNEPFSPLAIPTRAAGNAMKLVGGPNPLLITLLGSALGAGVGGLGGWAASRFMPEYLDKKRAPRNLAILGALLGAAPGAWIGGHEIANQGIKGLIKKWPPPTETKQSEYDPEFSGVQWVIDNYDIPTSEFIKKAALAGAGDVLPNIDEPQWRSAMFADPYLSMKEKAVSAGLPFSAGLARQKRFVSPMDVARISFGAGLGAATGKAVGHIASGFLGLTPKARQGIQQVGLLAGLVRSAIGTL